MGVAEINGVAEKKRPPVGGLFCIAAFELLI
jgi:hypothetical protein